MPAGQLKIILVPANREIFTAIVVAAYRIIGINYTKLTASVVITSIAYFYHFTLYEKYYLLIAHLNLLEKKLDMHYIISMIKEALAYQIKVAASDKLSQKKLKSFVRAYMKDKQREITGDDIVAMAKIISKARSLLKFSRL